ncbi:MAG: hypothetical protein R3272_16850, partial [Candidatus Promineifilaceae bacterium]|nr:hypothetical protein [Candidatus Promineifilaceae bacterium]
MSDRFWPEYPDEPGPVEFTPAGQEHPILSGLTPDALSGNFDATPIDRVGPGWTVLAKAVNDPNLALAAGQYGSGRMAYHTGNIESGSIDPGSDAYVRQLIEWAAAASAPDGPDMAIDAIEVTQAVQDLNNSVDLVAGKTTFVRVHVSSPATAYDVFANLSAERDGMRLFPTLHPGNPGADIAVRPFPDRGAINDSYWFELPAGWTTPGTVTLTATLDPAAAQGDPDRSNNAMSAVVDFLSTPPLALQLFDVRYTEDGTTYTAGNKHLDALEEWLEAAYPIPNLDQQRQTFNYPKDGLPDVDELHGYLAIAKLLNIFINDEDGDVVYYGIVDDEGGFMRGKALDIPSDIAAGPTGDTDTHAAGDQVEDWTWGWDYDGSYGDWYGGHELGHTQGRWHAEFCGAADGKSYPYTGGRISPALSGDNALYGFDIRDRTIYGPSWKDVMSYCDNEWVSDFTYEGIRDHMVANQQAAQTEAPDALESPAVTADRFALVVASVDLATNTGAIDNVYILDQTKEMPLPEPGDWTLVLLDGADNVLATHSVEAHQLTASEQVEGIPAIIRAAVPAPEALHRLELRHDGNTVDAREVSANAPTVNITAPEPNQELPAGDITFSWEGSDPDGDSLTYSLFYSHDDGMSWTPLTSATSATELTLPSDRLPGGTSHLRVVASDGMLTGSDVVGPFYAPAHAPQVEITHPADGATFWAAQLVSFRVDAYDLEDGPLSGNSILWTSSIDGELGTGRALSTVNLSTGLHTITAEATDSTGRSAQAQITFEVLTGDAPEPSRLEATPDAIDPVVPLN